MVDFLLAVVMLLNFALLGSGRIRVLIRVAALQGMVISALPLALGFLWAGGHERLAWHDLLAGSEVLSR